MNKVNPLVLFFILFFLLVVVVGKENSLHNEVQAAQKDTVVFEQEAKNIIKLKSSWDKTNLEQRVKSIFQTSEISQKINMIDKNGYFEIKGTNLTENEANELVKKILNSTFEIQKFELTKTSENSISILVEVVK